MLLSPVETARSAVPEGGLTSRVSVASGGAQGTGPSVAADVAADGRHLVFQSVADLTTPPPPSTPPSADPGAPSGVPDVPGETPPASRVYARDRAAGTTTALTDPLVEDATAPSVSGGGRLVAYSGTRSDLDYGLYVVDRDPGTDGVLDGPEQDVTRRVTGATTDLRYQRTIACPERSSEQYGDNRACAPQLSVDGTTLAFPTRLDPVSAQLFMSLVQHPTDSDPRGQVPVPVSPTRSGGTGVVDFGFTGVGFPSFADVTVAVHGPDPVTFGPASITGDAVFGIQGCAGDVAPGQQCTIRLSYQPTPQGCPMDGAVHSFRAVLELNGTTRPGSRCWHWWGTACAARR